MSNATTEPRNIGRNANWSCDAWAFGEITVLDMEDGTFALVRVIDADEDEIEQIACYSSRALAFAKARSLAGTPRAMSVNTLNIEGLLGW